MPAAPKPIFRPPGAPEQPPPYEMNDLGGQSSRANPAATATFGYTNSTDVENQTPTRRALPTPSIGIIAMALLMCAAICAACIYGLYVTMEMERRWSYGTRSALIFGSVVGYIVAVVVMVCILSGFESVKTRIHYIGTAGVLGAFIAGMVLVFRMKSHPSHGNFIMGVLLLSLLAGILLEVVVCWLQGIVWVLTRLGRRKPAGELA